MVEEVAPLPLRKLQAHVALKGLPALAYEYPARDLRVGEPGGIPGEAGLRCLQQDLPEERALRLRGPSTGP